MSNDNAIIRIENLQKAYRDNESPVPVLRGVTFSVAPGEVVAIVGSSGSGKSTLLHCAGGLDQFDAGRVVIGGTDLATLSEHGRDELRNHRLGFVYQFHHLLPEFTALENTAMPLLIRRTPQPEAYAAAEKALAALGLSERLQHLPSQLSGGERQRTAIARALVTHPQCVLADEPTGNLDHDTALAVFDNFVATARSEHAAIVIVTHDTDLAARCDRILRLVAGRIEA